MLLKNIASEILLSYLTKFPIAKGKYCVASLASNLLDGSVITSKYGPKLITRFKDSTFWLMARYGNDECFSFLQDLTDSDILIDIGANCGLFSIFASNYSKLVISIEPSWREFLELIKNIEINKSKNIIPVNLCISDRSEIVELNINCLSHTGGNSLIKTNNTILSQKSLGLNLDQLLLDLINLNFKGNSYNFVIKVDIEGYEPQALVGMTSILQTGLVRKVIVEINQQRLIDLSNNKLDIYKFMKDLNYQATIGEIKGHYDECFVPVNS
jgi:FkbM family methyltransferase